MFPPAYATIETSKQVETGDEHVEEVLKQIMGSLGTIQADIKDLKTDVAGLKTDVARLKTDVAGLKAEVGGLKAEVGGLKTDVAGLKSDVADLRERVAGLEEGQQQVVARMSDLEASQQRVIARLGHLEAGQLTLEQGQREVLQVVRRIEERQNDDVIALLKRVDANTQEKEYEVQTLNKRVFKLEVEFEKLSDKNAKSAG